MESQEPPPAEFVQRARLPSCGDLDLEQGEEIPEDAWDCLDDAFDTGAELRVTRPTVEGDPLVQYFRVGPDIEGVEIYHDMTLDRFGPGTWIHEVCPDAVSVRELGGCREA